MLTVNVNDSLTPQELLHDAPQHFPSNQHWRTEVIAWGQPFQDIY
jgi:hypothetical protein